MFVSVNYLISAAFLLFSARYYNSYYWLLILSHIGILQDLLTKARSNRIQIPYDVLNLLTELHKKATLTAKKAQPFLNATDPDYYRLGFVARHAWLFKRNFRSLDISLSQGTHFRQDARFAGRAMDQCISDLIGDPRTGAEPCNITDECWRFIGRNNTQGYMTTHQALYLMVGEVKGELHYLKRLKFFCVHSFISNKNSFRMSNVTVKRCSRW